MTRPPYFLIFVIFLVNFSFLRNICLSCILVDSCVWWTYLSLTVSTFLPIGATDTCVSSSPFHAQRGLWILTCLLILSFFLLTFLLLNLPIWAVDTCFYSFFFFSLAHRGHGYLLFAKKTPYFSVHRDLGYLRLVFFPCPTGPRIPALILFFLFLLPIGAVDTCFNFFFLTAHRGIWWMEIMVL